MKQFIYPFAVVLFFQSCNPNLDRKSDPTVIDFTFKDFYSGKPIAGLNVALESQKSTFMGAPPFPMETFVTDKDGKISFSFQNEQDYMYDVASQANKDYGGFARVELRTGERNTKTIGVKPFNVLRVHLVNSTKNSHNVFLTYRGGFAPWSYFKGAFTDTSILFRSVPETNGTIKLQFDLSEPTEFEIYIPKMDTVNVSYEYKVSSDPK